MKDRKTLESEVRKHEAEALQLLMAAAYSLATYESRSLYEMQIARALDRIIRAETIAWALQPNEEAK
jgi:hypothetical protein